MRSWKILVPVLCVALTGCTSGAPAPSPHDQGQNQAPRSSENTPSTDTDKDATGDRAALEITEVAWTGSEPSAQEIISGNDVRTEARDNKLIVQSFGSGSCSPTLKGAYVEAGGIVLEFPDWETWMTEALNRGCTDDLQRWQYEVTGDTIEITEQTKVTIARVRVQ